MIPRESGVIIVDGRCGREGAGNVCVGGEEVEAVDRISGGLE